jgi:predicted secreted protein
MRHQDLLGRIVLDENFEMTSAASYVGGSRLDYSLVNLIFGTTSPAMNALTYQAAARNAFTPAPTTANGVRQVSGGIIPTDLQPFYALGVQGFSTFSSTPYYHTTQDNPDKIDPGSHERVTAMLRDVLTDVQSVPPESLLIREVPVVSVSAPASALPGAEVPVEISVTDPAGQPVTGVPVRVLVNQRDHWAVAEGPATELGDGRYRYTVPAGATEADTTNLTATVDQPQYIAQGFGRVDQRAGGVLKPARACLSRRRITVHVPRRFSHVRARVSAGRVRVRGHTIRVDLRGVRKRTVRLRVTARRGHRTVRQTRTYRTCTPGPRRKHS